MIELEKAQALARKHPFRVGTETIPLGTSPGRVLAEDVFADRDMPPFNRATMDGYACRREDLPGPLEVLETLPAGRPPTRRVDKGQCSRIMTGAMVPEGADCVIMQEYVETGQDGQIVFTAGETETHIDPRGQDLKEGDLLLPKGTLLSPGHIGIIASAGKTRVEVSESVLVGILATGSELVTADQRPERAQIRNSNTHQLAAQVRRAGHMPRNLGIVEDHPETLAESIRAAMDQVNLLLLTGGASVGEFDLVPGVLNKLGLKMEYDRVAIQPGKPVTFAHRGRRVCFGLSGNTVSSFVQFELLVRPYLEACTGMIPVNRRIRIRMDADYHRKDTERRFFLPVCFTGSGDCEPLEYHGSGHLHALARAAGLAEIPIGQNTVKKGDLVHVRLI
jgi:molybdopterin molybdotransferase